jgi:hypothetical protein
MADDDTLRETAREQSDAARIIGTALQDMFPITTDNSAERFARAVIARLTHNDPPLLVVYTHNVKEKGD